MASNFQDEVDAFRAKSSDAVLIHPAGSMTKPNKKIIVETVHYKGEQIGRIQTTIEGGVTRILTISPETSVRGLRIDWLINSANKEDWLSENTNLRKRQAKRKIFNGGLRLSVTQQGAYTK